MKFEEQQVEEFLIASRFHHYSIKLAKHLKSVVEIPAVSTSLNRKKMETGNLLFKFYSDSRDFRRSFRAFDTVGTLPRWRSKTKRGKE